MIIQCNLHNLIHRCGQVRPALMAPVDDVMKRLANVMLLYSWYVRCFAPYKDTCICAFEGNDVFKGARTG